VLIVSVLVLVISGSRPMYTGPVSDHFDHLDLQSLQYLVKQDQFPILAGLGIKKLLETKGFTNIIELDW